ATIQCSSTTDVESESTELTPVALLCTPQTFILTRSGKLDGFLGFVSRAEMSFHATRAADALLTRATADDLPQATLNQITIGRDAFKASYDNVKSRNFDRDKYWQQFDKGRTLGGLFPFIRGQRREEGCDRGDLLGDDEDYMVCRLGIPN